MPSVYIAAPYPLKMLAQATAKVLMENGIHSTARWCESNDVLEAAADKDLEDIRTADILVALNPPDWSEKGTGGRHVEFGYALALGKPTVLVGPPTNVFHYKASIRIFAPTSIVDAVRLVAKQHGLD